MEHSFNVEFAQKYGIEEAIIVHNFYFWIKKNTANDKHSYNGRYWTYNSNNAFCSLFPYINKTKIFRVLKNLDEQGIILKGNFNTDVWNKTLWYSFSDKGLAILVECGYDVIDFIKMNQRCLQNEPTITDSKHTDSITDNNKDNKNNKFNFLQAVIDLGVDEQVAKDWLLVRKDKKATNTQTAFERIAKEIRQCAITPNECISIAVERSWIGFKVEWLDNIFNKKNTNNAISTPKQVTDNSKMLRIRVVRNDGKVLYLEDGTVFKNNHRYYTARNGKEYSIPVDEMARPDDRYQYRNGEGWYLPFDLEQSDDLLWD